MTIKEISSILGVSATTVSNVVNGHTEKMSVKTRKEVEDALILYDFKKPFVERGNSQDLRLVSVDFNLRFRENIFMDPFCAELLDSICSALKEYGRYPVCGNLEDTKEAYEKIKARSIEGGIVIGFEPWDCHAFCEKVGKPVVFIDCGNGEYDNVGIADYEGGKLITEFLLNQGHKKIAFLSDRKIPVSSNLERYQGFCDTLEAKGIKPEHKDYYYLPNEKNLRRETLREFAKRVKIEGYTAAFVVSDLLANEAVHTFIEEGLSVPGDISVTGFDDNFYARLCEPQLTTIRQPVAEKGRQAVRLLMQRLQQEDTIVNSYRLPVELIVRDSVRNIS
jgi:LacI family transcriptional regulator